MFPLIVLLPFIVSFICCIALKSHGKYPKYIALGAGLITLVLAIVLLLSPQSSQTINWFSAGSVLFTLDTAIFNMNKLLLMLVTVMAPIITYYSFGIINTDSEQGRYYAILSLFTVAMLLFSISNGFITVLIAWGLMGITSYLMIGFWYKRRNSPSSARKAITTMVIGDVAMIGGVAIIWAGYSTFSFTAILAAPPSLYLTSALSLILIAVFTKSAQFPFNGWLPDAMEGPTPVSAFIHSSTMVKAGVFLVAVLLPLFARAGLTTVLIVIGCVTALIGATNALRETHIKRVLAYSTMEDIGIMFIALGFLSIPAAIILFFVQTFYKALLFLSAGTVIAANNGEENITKSYGLKSNKILLTITIIAALSLIGLFPLSGFFGKAAVATAASGNIIVYIILNLVELISAVYMIRWVYYISRQPTKERRAELSISYKILPKCLIAAGVVVLALLIASSAYPLYLTGFMGWNVNIILIEALTATGMIAIGALLAYLFYYHTSRKPLLGGKPDFLLDSEFAIDWFYLSTVYVFSAIASAANSLEIYFNKVEGLFNRLGLWAGRKIGLTENGQIGTYLFAAILGFILISLLVMVLI
jgi:NADH-quinone oxidoreductase subunit L